MFTYILKHKGQRIQVLQYTVQEHINVFTVHTGTLYTIQCQIFFFINHTQR